MIFSKVKKCIMKLFIWFIHLLFFAINFPFVCCFDVLLLEVQCGKIIDLFCGEITILEGTHVGARAVYNCYTTGETRIQLAYCDQSGAWWFPVQDCRK